MGLPTENINHPHKSVIYEEHYQLCIEKQQQLTFCPAKIKYLKPA